MKTLSLILGLVVLSTAQKQHKHGKHGHGKPAYVASATGPSHGGGGGQSHNEQPVYYGGGGGQSSHNNYGSGKAEAKHVYPQLLADTRTLNTDGTINFNFQADNGLNQGETVDADGTRRGFYSYPGADGKILTVKYTAGKNGFVAEGDHLPMQPQSASHSEKDEAYVPKSRPGRQETDSGQYNPAAYGTDDGSYKGDDYRGEAEVSSHGGGRPHSRPSQGHHARSPSHGGSRGLHHSSPYSQGGNGGSNSFVGFGDGSSQGFSSPQTNYQFTGGAGSPSQGGGGARPYNGGGQGAGRFPGGGSPSYSSFSGPSIGSYNSASGAPASFGGSQGGSPGGGGFMYNAANPYQPEDGSAPFNGAFDLGNSGHFSINFNPGSAQQYTPGGEDFDGGAPGGGQISSQSFGGAPGAGGGRGGGTRGQY